MANTLLAGQSQAERCAICARPARRGATLCEQCKAAVRRARHAPSVQSQSLPLPAAPVGATRYRERTDPLAPSPRRTARAGISQVLGGWGTYATLIAFGLAVCLTGYLAIGDKDSALYIGHETPSAGAVQGDPAAQAPPLSSLAIESEASSEGVLPAGERIAWIQWSAPAPRGLPEGKPARDVKAGSYALPAAGARNAPAQWPSPTPAPQPVAVAVAATATPEPPVRDRWQELAFAVSRCERENLLVGFVCKERARLQYCEGEWGTAPQCSAAEASNNTR